MYVSTKENIIFPNIFVRGFTCGKSISIANKVPAILETKSLGLEDFDLIIDFVIRKITKFSIMFIIMYWSM